MIRSFLSAFLLLTLSLSLSAQNAMQLVKNGDLKMAAKNYTGAIQDYTSAVQMNEATTTDFMKKVADFNKLTEYQKALRDDNADITKGGHDLALPYYCRGIAFVATSEFPEALKNFDMAISVDPKYADAYYQRALINNSAGNKNEACIDFKLAMDMGHAKAKEDYATNNCSSFSVNYYNEGLDKFYDKNYEGAANDFTLSLKINSDTATYFRRGLCYFNSGKYDKAIADFNKAIQVEIDSLQNSEYPFMKGMAYYNQEKFKQAYEGFTQAIKENGKHYYAFLYRAYCNESLIQIPSASYDYSNAIRIRPKDGLAYYKLGMIKQDANDSKAACDNFKKAAQFGNEDAKAFAKDCIEAEKKERRQE